VLLIKVVQMMNIKQSLWHIFLSKIMYVIMDNYNNNNYSDIMLCACNMQLVTLRFHMGY